MTDIEVSEDENFGENVRNYSLLDASSKALLDPDFKKKTCGPGWILSKPCFDFPTVSLIVKYFSGSIFDQMQEV